MKTCFIVSSEKELALRGNEYEEPFVTVKKELGDVLRSLYSKGYQRFITGAEWGIPLWAGEMLVNLRTQHPDIMVTIIIPYEEQAKDWFEYQRDRYFKLHQDADEVILLHTHWCETAEEDALAYALEQSDLLFVFGKPEDDLQAVQLANDLNVKTTYI